VDKCAVIGQKYPIVNVFLHMYLGQLRSCRRYDVLVQAEELHGIALKQLHDALHDNVFNVFRQSSITAYFIIILSSAELQAFLRRFLT
jgi:hypothetical protein